MRAAGAQLAQSIGPSTALSVPIQALWLRAFLAFWLVLLRDAPQASQKHQKPLAPRLSFPLQSLPQAVLRQEWLILFLQLNIFHYPMVFMRCLGFLILKPSVSKSKRREKVIALGDDSKSILMTATNSKSEFWFARCRREKFSLALFKGKIEKG